ncbi:MAG: hypothetical protein IH945_04600 [Armatimonadetes bacterium]|nr:hypothetical protein [Armatimonadota bacterium]
MFTTLTIFVAFAITSQDRADVPVKNVSAGYIVELMTPTGSIEQESPRKSLTHGAPLVPKGVTIIVTPGRNSITVSGPIEGVRETVQVIEIFDVAPRAVELDIKASVPHLNRQFSASTSIYSNSKWTYSNTRTGTNITVEPRVNNDDTITMIFRGGTLGTSAIGAVRVNAGEEVYVWIRPENVENRETGKIENRLVFHYALPRAEVASFLTDLNPVTPDIDWTTRQYNADRKLEDQSPLNPPAEADLRIRIIAALPEDTSSR